MKENNDNIENIIKKRTPINRRIWTDDYHKLGVIGEEQFAKEFNQPFNVETAVYPGGNGGKDFFLEGIGRIDIKTSRKPYNLWCDVEILKSNKSDIIVQTQYFDRTESATLLAWEFVKNFEKFNIRTFREVSYFVMPIHLAFPIWGLKKMCGILS